LIFVACLRSKSIPDGFAGIWSTSDGQVLALLGSHPSQLRFNNFEYEVNDIGQVPSGAYVGSWVRCKALRVDSLNVVEGPRLLGISNWEGDIYGAKSAMEAGDFRFTFGRPYSDGSIHSIQAALTTESNRTKLNDLFFWDFGFEKVSFDGSYEAPHMGLKIEPSEDGKTYKGRFTYNGVQYVLTGVRTGIRLGFRLDEVDYNRKAGWGYVDWTPSVGRIEKIKNGDSTRSDKIFIYVALPKVLASGTSLEMHD